MQIKWIEDFLALTDARAFSRAAEHRNLTQPTFSRHIQSLEEWLGVELIDRRMQGVQLTSAGRIFRGFAADLLRRTYDMRNILRGHTAGSGETIRFAVAHTISLTYFPRWLNKLKTALNHAAVRVSAVNISEGANALIEGDVPFPNGYAAVRRHVRNVHFKDARRYADGSWPQNDRIPLMSLRRDP